MLVTKRNIKQVFAILAVLLISLPSANADVIFQDNFDADTQGTPAGSLLNWDINLPSVDVVGSGFHQHLCNNNTAGNCLDMDGSPPGNGQITTKVGLNLAAGNYTFSFDYGNNSANNNSLAWNIGTLADGIVYTGVANNNTYSQSVNNFTLSTAALGVYITFTGGGTADARGTVLDNVLLEGPAYTSVPEPSTLSLLSLCILSVLGAGRRQRRA